jgi:hypothetical protein
MSTVSEKSASQKSMACSGELECLSERWFVSAWTMIFQWGRQDRQLGDREGSEKGDLMSPKC